MYKKCSKCKEEKLFNEFTRSKSCKDGYYNYCKICRKQYYEANREFIAECKQEHYRVNKDRLLAEMREYREINKEQIANRMRRYQKENSAKISANTAKRRSLKLQSTPPWLTQEDFEQIEEFYKKAQQLKSVTGQQYHVDHIVPLQGENVCGLHVPWNLQILEASENIKKSNKLLED